MRLKEWRKRRGLTLMALADKAGVHYVSLANIEAGKEDPRLSTLLKLCKALNIDLVELVGKKQIPTKGGK